MRRPRALLIKIPASTHTQCGYLPEFSFLDLDGVG